MLGRHGGRVLLAALALASLARPAASQDRGWQLTHFSTRHGLPSPYVKAAVEDRLGFLWLATDGGLVRYDGEAFAAYPDEPSGLFLKALILLPDGRLLAAGDAGLSLVRSTPRGPEVTLLVPGRDEAEPTSVVYPKGLFRDSAGRVWISEPRAIVRYEPGRPLVRYPFDSRDWASSFVRSFAIVEDEGGRIFAMSQPGRLYALGEDDRFSPVAGADRPGPIEGVNHVVLVGPGRLWAAADSGLFEVRLPEGARSARVTRLGEVRDASWLRVRTDDVLVATYGSHVWVAGRAPGAAAPRPLTDAAPAQHLFETAAGALWLSADDGLRLLERRAFEPVPLEHDRVAIDAESFARADDGSLFACDRHAVYRLTEGAEGIRGVRIYHDPSALFMSLLSDAGRLWVAGLDTLVEVRDGRAPVAFDVSETGTYVVGLAGDGASGLWVAQFDAEGLTRLLPGGTRRHYGREEGLVSRVRALRRAPDGVLWAGGTDAAAYLYRYDPRADAFVNESHPLPFPEPDRFTVLDLDADSRGRLWLATSSGPLVHDADGLRRVPLGPELTSLPTHTLRVAPDGIVWLASSLGLVRFDPASLEYVLFDEREGLPSRSISLRGILPAPGGRVWVATTRGFARLSSPDSAPTPPAAPSFLLVRAGGEAVDPDSAPVNVAHGALLEARFSALGRPGPFVYQTRVEGAGADWAEPSPRSELTVAGLSPGSYRLLARAAPRGSNRWSEPGVLAFVVRPAWYQRWWAWVAALVVLGALVRLGQWIQARRAARDETRLRAIVDARTRELRDANRQLADTNAELERFAYTVSHDLKTPLVTISGFLGQLDASVERGDLDAFRSDLQRIRGAARRMNVLLDELLELSRVGRRMNPPEPVPLGEVVGEAARLVEGRLAPRGVALELEGDLPTVLGDREQLVLLVQNLLENAARFMGDQASPRVKVGVRGSGEALVLYVEDNGIGIEPRHHERVFGLFDKLDPASEGTGVGLAIVKRIAEVHGGRVWIESDGHGSGTRVCFTLPVAPPVG